MTTTIGLISDTHGLLRPEVFAHFAGVEHIVHAGDVGRADLLAELEALAPVTAVWGNVDGWEIRHRVPEVARVELGGVRVAVMHGQQVGSPTPLRMVALLPDAELVVFGHSHRAVVQKVGAVWAVNPGSAGPARFGATPTLAVAELRPGEVRVEVIELGEPRAAKRTPD